MPSVALAQHGSTFVERNALAIINGHIYRYKVLRVNYTTYDLRWARESLNPRTHSDVMVPCQNQAVSITGVNFQYSEIGPRRNVLQCPVDLVIFSTDSSPTLQEGMRRRSPRETYDIPYLPLIINVLKVT